MCSAGFRHFCCGCRTLLPGSLQLCEYAKLKGGRACPDFQIDEDAARAEHLDLLPCMRHS